MKPQVEDHTGCGCGGTGCLDCSLPARERLNYFTGQFLAERDFRDEQEYFVSKHRAHNKFLHGYGTVCGLRVTEHPNSECRDRYVVIEPGLALDCCGREIVVCEKTYVDIPAEIGGRLEHVQESKNHLLVSLCYKECKTEFVPALFSECGCDDTRCEANRLHESFEVKVQRTATLPEPRPQVPERVRLEWKTTLNMSHPSALALDEQHRRLFVLSSDHVFVFDANNHALLQSLDIGGQGSDLAISPDGRYVYTPVHKAGTATKNNLHVTDIQDLSNPASKDVALADGPFNAKTQVRVAAATGQVFVLDGNASKKVRIWNAPSSQSQLTSYAEIDAGLDLRSIAVSPDGAWLFAADGTAPKFPLRIYKVQSPAAPPFHSIDLDKPAVDISVASDNSTVAVLTEAKRVHAYRIQATTPPFPETGTGADIGTVNPIKTALAPNGSLAYVLVQDQNQKAGIEIVDVQKIKSDPSHAVASPVSVITAPLDVLLSSDGRKMYVASDGTAAFPTGGVSVIDVFQEPCEDILWRALEGCPACGDDSCVLLAAISPYSDGKPIQDADINNRIRPLAPSTETLRELILCALECCDGKAGKDGKDGANGKDGQDGVGLELGLVQISALSWVHNTPSTFAKILGIDGRPKGEGLVIGFTGEVDVGQIAEFKHVFQVFVPEPDPNNLPFPDPAKKDLGLVCRCEVLGEVIPVKVTANIGNVITEAQQVAGSKAKAVAFLFTSKIGTVIVKTGGVELWVKLRGDFVLDTQATARAIDAEFVRAEFNTGDRPKNSKYGIQGGLFESWFTTKRG